MQTVCVHGLNSRRYGWGALFLAIACNGGSGDDGGNATTGGPGGDPSGDPSGDPTGDPGTSGTSSPTGTPTTSDATGGTMDPGDTSATVTDPTGSTTLPDPGELVEPGDPGPGDVSFEIRADQDTRPISPRIYGHNQPHDLDTALRGLGLIRQGGNRMTAYNWENNASNAGSDYMHQNDDYLEYALDVDGSIPGEVARFQAQQALDAGADALLTVQICGHVAADKNGGGDVNQTPNFLDTRFHPTIAAKGAPFSDPPDTSDHAVYQDEFVAFLKSRLPDAFTGDDARILFSLDNEPDLWADTHARIHPDPVGYAELAQKNAEFATAVKAVAPNATIAGFVSYGFNGYVTLQNAPDPQGDTFIDFYLAAMNQAEQDAGTRVVDVLDLHWYTEVTANGQRITGDDTSPDSVAARVQAPRSLWDPTFHENSWIANDYLQGPIALLPWLQAKIDANYPGTGIGFTEYNYGGGGHISGAIAQADVLGIFGRDGVALAAYWALSDQQSFIDAAFRVFTSYDDAGAHFGDTSIHALTSDVERTSVYASVDAQDPARTVVVAINKTDAPLSAAVTLAAYADYSGVQVWQLTGGAPTLTSTAGPALAATNAFLYDMPAYSVSVLVPTP